MNIILLERIENLGQMGDVVRVKDGYARNFLLPQKKALRATEANQARFDEQRAQLEATNLDRRKDAEAISGKLEGLVVTMIRQAGDTGQLYGSATGRDVAEAITEAGFTVTRSQVQLDRAIKSLGLHPVRVILHPEVSITVSANIARTEDEAAMQLRGETPGAEPDEAEVEIAPEVTELLEQEAAEQFEAAEVEAEADSEDAPDAPEPAEETPATEDEIRSE
jgi:large subunit ribosomal protein L9